jgi:choline dehydrogenase-like flavoprotein
MPPLQQFRQAELLDRGFTALGKRTAPLPAIINSVPYNGRPPCIYDGWCDAGCPIGALANPLITYIPRARKAGADFRAGCYVTRIEAAGPERVGGVEYVQDGKVRRQPAKVVIVAASVMENVRLLLNSTSTWHGAGLGNRSGLVGAYLGTECAVQGFALFNEETQCHLGLSAGHRIYREGYVSPARPGMFAGYQWQLATAMKPNDIFGVAMTRPDIFGAALHEFMRTGVRHAATMLAFGGGVPARENRAVLSDRKDAFGMPLVRTEHRWTPDMAALIEHLHVEAKELLRASSARESWTGRTGTGHIIGGTLMGSDPAASVTDSFGRVHGMENLFVAGGSLFPGSAGTSPTYTIHAVSQRAARHVISRWAEFH